MIYSIVATILLTIITSLFLVSIRNSLRDEERLERKVREANSVVSRQACKVLRLKDKADSLSRQVRYLEESLRVRNRRCAM